MRPRFGLRAKYAAVIGGFMVIALAITTLQALYVMHRSFQAGHAAQLAQAIANDIDRHLSDTFEWLLWATFPADPDADAVEQKYIDFLKILRFVPDLTDVAWIGLDGTEKLKVSRFEVTMRSTRDQWTHRPEFKRVIDKAKEVQERKALHYVEARHGQTGRIVVRIAYAALDGDGVIIANLGLRRLQDLIGERQLPQGTAVRVMADNVAVAMHSGGSRGAASSPPEMAGVAQTSPRAASLLSSVLGFVTLGRSGPMVERAASVENLGWRVVVQTSAHAPDAMYGETLRVAAIIVALGLALTIAFSIFLAWRMVLPIGEIQTGAGRLNSGDLAYRIPVRSRDEVGLLAAEFNSMADSLASTLRNQEAKVHERTKELNQAVKYETEAARVLRTIAGSPGNAGPAFRAIVQTAMELFGARQVWLARVDGDRIRGVEGAGAEFPERGAQGLFIAPLDRNTITGQAILAKEPRCIPDLRDEAVPDACRNYCRVAGIRALLSMPLMREGAAVGALTIGRGEAGAFSDRQVKLADVLADFAVIAMENARQFEDLSSKSKQLAEANQHKSEFVARMSHELRSPLTLMLGFSQRLKQEKVGPLNEKQKQYARDIEDAAKTQLDLINDLLDMAKIEAGKIELNVRPFDVRPVIESCLMQQRVRAQGAKITLDASLDASLGSFHGDERKFRQILTNLLTNALKFTPKGGAVRVKAQSITDGIQVSVSDTGRGISAEDQKQLFREFVQVGVGRNSPQGTGLGLAIIKHFIELHGGRISVVSAVDEGATFIFELKNQSAKPAAVTV